MENSKAETKVSFKKAPKDRPVPLSEWAPFFIIKSKDKTKIFYIPQNKELIIGRKKECNIYLNDELVSRNHARIIFSGGNVKMTDLGSTNGTSINGQNIKEKVLEDGDEIVIGFSVFQFYIPMSIGDRASGISIKTHNYFESRFEEELDRTSRYERPLSLMMIAFSEHVEPNKNDKRMGELVLAVKSLIRTMDIFACYSKYEIELMLPETNKEESFKLAKRILKEAKSRFKFDIYIGISSFPEDSPSKEILIDKCRRALNLSRKKDKDQISDSGSDNVRILVLSEREIIVKSDKMNQVFEMVNRIASSNISVLIQGETGVGKEVVAEAVHYNSPRKNRHLICVNCVALTETLLESELFGHERGSFTGADRRKIGLFETAKGGTIFLDEIGEMPLKTQAKLLRVLQFKKIMRVGSSQEIDIDIRIIAATNKNLEELVSKGIFREDLFYRLNAITVYLPPLRERKEEIPALVNSFITEFNNENKKTISGLAPDSMDMLTKYEWPGNIRELKNCIERAVVIAESDTIYKENLAAKIFKSPFSKRLTDESEKAKEEDKETFVGDMKEIIASYEKKLISNALTKANWNQTKAAEMLKIPRRTLVSKIKKYNIELK